LWRANVKSISLGEYVDLAHQLIQSNLSPADNGITAARLGFLLRQSQPGLDWKAFGFGSLKGLLEYMEQHGLVEVGDNAKKALAVWPPTKSFELRPPATSKPTFNPITKPFWVAFVVHQPQGRRFYHRPSGTIRMGLRDEPSPADEWVEITPISEETQKSWARAFITKRQLQAREELADALNEPDWYRAFPEALANIDVPLTREWNRSRSARVSETVQSWCAASALDPAVAFQGKAVPVGGEPQVSSKTVPARRPAQRPDSLRATVLSALARLPTEYLLEIPIPAKYLLREEAAQQVSERAF
jgi:hypothetical protein